MKNAEKNPLVIITGPTAAGKSALAVALAKRIGGEVISADSMQVYRGMDIGSAKITPEEMEGVPHHLLDILEPEEEFSAAAFKELADQAIQDIYKRGKIPIIAGGTGFYIQTVLYDIRFNENETDPEYRAKLEKEAAKGEEGILGLYNRLREIDPLSAERIHQNNIKRVIRALEYYHLTGQPISLHNDEQARQTSPYNFAYFVLTDDRAAIYERIDRRVDKMIKAGLEAEVKKLKDRGCTRDMVSMQGLGYKEMLDYLNGECTLEQAVYLIKRDSRHFAKRQLTWFRRERDVRWLDHQEFNNEEDILEEVCSQLKDLGIIN